VYKIHLIIISGSIGIIHQVIRHKFKTNNVANRTFLYLIIAAKVNLRKN